MKRPEDVAGWMAPKELDVLRDLAARHQPRVVVEIGSFVGRSSLAWAQALPDATIYCIDLFGDDFIRGILKQGNLLDPDLTHEDRWRTLYSLFLENTWGHENIRHLRCDSRQLKELWHGGKVDLFFIDGHHSFELVIADLNTARSLRADVICGHDYGYPGYGGPEHKGVTAAVDQFAYIHAYKLVHHIGTSIFELTA